MPVFDRVHRRAALAPPPFGRGLAAVVAPSLGVPFLARPGLGGVVLLLVPRAEDAGLSVPLARSRRIRAALDYAEAPRASVGVDICSAHGLTSIALGFPFGHPHRFRRTLPRTISEITSGIGGGGLLAREGPS
jgi:hypothetical protein